MKTSTLLLFAAAAAALYVLSKRASGQQPAKPGSPFQPSGPPSTTVQYTSGPNSSGPTLVQQFGGAPGIAEGVGKLTTTIWDRLAASSDDEDQSDGPTYDEGGVPEGAWNAAS